MCITAELIRAGRVFPLSTGFNGEGTWRNRTTEHFGVRAVIRHDLVVEGFAFHASAPAC
jgi:hypothetical protein